MALLQHAYVGGQWGVIAFPRHTPTLCVCAIFKDEAPYLREWVAYHHLMGVDHFVLYDNGSADGGGELLRDFDYVTVIPWPHRPGQQLAYEDFRTKYSRHWDWVAFIDLDEFVCTSGPAIPELLRSYAGFSAVLLHWLTFSSGGHETRPAGLVIDSYRLRLPEHHEINHHIKSLVRCADLLDARAVHHFKTRGRVCNAIGEEIPNQPLHAQPCHRTMWINHYRYKSREEWLARVAKRRADVPDSNEKALRPIDTIDWVNRAATIWDEQITRLSGRVRLLMA